MTIWVCPICDHEMKRKHYCSNCRAFIRTPLIGEKSENKDNFRTKEPASEQVMLSCRQAEEWTKKADGSSDRTNKKKWGRVKRFIFQCAMIYTLVCTIYGLVKGRNGSLNNGEPAAPVRTVPEKQGAVDQGGNTYTSGDSQYTVYDLTLKEIKKSGKPCNSNLHYGVLLQDSYKEVRRAAQKCFGKEGLTVRRYQNNTCTVWKDADGTVADSTDYGEFTEFICDDGSLFRIKSDSVTGNIANIYVTHKDDNVGKEITQKMLSLLDPSLDFVDWAQLKDNGSITGSNSMIIREKETEYHSYILLPLADCFKDKD